MLQQRKALRLLLSHGHESAHAAPASVIASIELTLPEGGKEGVIGPAWGDGVREVRGAIAVLASFTASSSSTWFSSGFPTVSNLILKDLCWGRAHAGGLQTVSGRQRPALLCFMTRKLGTKICDVSEFKLFCQPLLHL